MPSYNSKLSPLMSPMNGSSSSSSSSTYPNVSMSPIYLPDGTAGSLLPLQQNFREQQQQRQMSQAKLNWQVTCTTLRHMITLLGSVPLIMLLHSPPTC
jgi:hypothetical protein